MDMVYLLLWCGVCQAATPHTVSVDNPKCIPCRDKDRREVEEALDRIRKAEGAQALEEEYPEQGDIFDAGDDPC